MQNHYAPVSNPESAFRNRPANFLIHLSIRALVTQLDIDVIPKHCQQIVSPSVFKNHRSYLADRIGNKPAKTHENLYQPDHVGADGKSMP